MKTKLFSHLFIFKEKCLLPFFLLTNAFTGINNSSQNISRLKTTYLKRIIFLFILSFIFFNIFSQVSSTDLSTAVSPIIKQAWLYIQLALGLAIAIAIVSLVIKFFKDDHNMKWEIITIIIVVALRLTLPTLISSITGIDPKTGNYSAQ